MSQHALVAPPDNGPKPPRKRIPLEAYLVLIAALQISADLAQLWGVSPL